MTMADTENNSNGNNGNTAELMAKLLLTREEVSQLLEVPRHHRQFAQGPPSPWS